MEYEIKLAVPQPELLTEILQNELIQETMMESVREIPMETTYYDAADGSLGAKKWTLRRRMEGGTPVVTLKTPAEQKNYRNEWETEGTDVLQAVPDLIALGAPETLRKVQNVVPVCGAKFLRKAVLLQLEGCQAELALDAGILFRGERQTGLCELELELKDGKPDAMLRLGAYLKQRYGLQTEEKSKFWRARNL